MYIKLESCAYLTNGPVTTPAERLCVSDAGVTQDQAAQAARYHASRKALCFGRRETRDN